MKILNYATASSLLFVFAGSVYAQTPTLPATQATAAQTLHKLDSKMSGPGIRISKLMGMNIQNSNKENVGQIKDIVVDPVSSQIQYVAVTYGGFLGLGDKMFAVPIQAIKVQQDPDNRDRIVLVLDVTKDQMNGAQGFDEANWPNFSDAKFSGELHRRYKVENRWKTSSARDGDVDLKIGRDGVNLNVDGLKK